MKVAFISGPYRSDTPSGIVRNIRSAEAVAVELWRMGYAVICPHMNSALMDGLCPDETWLKGDLEMLRRCDLVVMIPRWRTSEGSKAEAQEAWLRKIPVYIWHDDKEMLREFVCQGHSQA